MSSNWIVAAAIIVVLLLGVCVFVPGVVSNVDQAGNVTPGTAMGNSTNSTHAIIGMTLTGAQGLMIIVGAMILFGALAMFGGKKW